MRLWSAAVFIVISATTLPAQTAPDLSGVWSPARLGGPRPSPILLKPEYKERYDARRAQEAEAAKRGEQLVGARGLCEPYGMPTMMQVAMYPMEIIQTPKQVTLIARRSAKCAGSTSARPQLSPDDVAPGYYGRSVGHWEGDTLVVDTIGIKESVAGYEELPHSDQMRITERIRRASPDRCTTRSRLRIR